MGPLLVDLVLERLALRRKAPRERRLLLRSQELLDQLALALALLAILLGSVAELGVFLEIGRGCFAEQRKWVDLGVIELSFEKTEGTGLGYKCANLGVEAGSHDPLLPQARLRPA